MHMDAGQRAGASVAAVIAHHTRQVLGYRPIGPAEQEDPDHG